MRIFEPRQSLFERAVLFFVALFVGAHASIEAGKRQKAAAIEASRNRIKQ